MSRWRVLSLVALATLLAVWLPSARVDAGPADPGLVRTTCAVPHEWLLRIWRGWRPDRGGNLQMLARFPNFVGSGLPHVGPWPYVQDVPMLWFGPGHIRARGEVDRPVTSVGIAPTIGELVAFPFTTSDGTPMTEALEPDVSGSPRLVIVVVWDAGGRNVLDAHANSWPYLRSLIPKGTWYERMSVGSTPTSTAQIHANIGTGVFPRTHGLVGHNMLIDRIPATAWGSGPAMIVVPTLADLYDRAMRNEPVVGTVATVNIHMGMMSHGAFFSGGDADIGMTRSVVDPKTATDEGFSWNLPTGSRGYFRLPPYLDDVGGLDRAVRSLDEKDGRLDGNWRDNDIQELLGGFETPARIPYQTEVLKTVIEREGFGADDVPDLLFVNYKVIDYISHVWTMNSPEMRDAVEWQDEALRDLVLFLDRQVGRGEWAVAVTADHGAVPDPEISGAFPIPTAPITEGIKTTFDSDGDDVPVLDLLQPTQLYLNEAELAENGHSMDDVARWVMGLTKADLVPAGTTISATEADDLVFQAAFPSALMEDLPCLPEAG